MGNVGLRWVKLGYVGLCWGTLGYIGLLRVTLNKCRKDILSKFKLKHPLKNQFVDAGSTHTNI